MVDTSDQQKSVTANFGHKESVLTLNDNDGANDDFGWDMKEIVDK